MNPIQKHWLSLAEAEFEKAANAKDGGYMYGLHYWAMNQYLRLSEKY